MNKKQTPILALEPLSAFILTLSMLFVSIHIHRSFHFPFPPFNTLIFDLSREFSHETSYERPLGSEGSYKDFAGILLGTRRLIADVGWISVLQYFGSHHAHSDDIDHAGETAAQNYPALKKMVLRVVRLDPSFYFAYLVGGGALAFSYDRPQEGLEILEEGIKHNPKYWKFRLYVGAIIYKQKGRFDDMITLLEEATRYPDCPTMIKSVLANIYKSNKKYARALEIWIGIYENGTTDAWYKEQAGKQIVDLRTKLGI